MWVKTPSTQLLYIYICLATKVRKKSSKVLFNLLIEIHLGLSIKSSLKYSAVVFWCLRGIKSPFWQFFSIKCALTYRKILRFCLYINGPFGSIFIPENAWPTKAQINPDPQNCFGYNSKVQDPLHHLLVVVYHVTIAF